MKKNSGINRRDFITRSGVMIGGLTMSAPTKWLLATTSSSNNHTLVYVFLRGGADGLTFLRPNPDSSNAILSDSAAALAAKRPDIQVAGGQATGDFLLHPAFNEPSGAALSVQSLFNNGKIALVHGVGSINPTRSHFQQQDLIERGNQSIGAGFLTRTVTQLASKSANLPAASIGPKLNVALSGLSNASAINSNLNNYISMESPGITASLGLGLSQRLQKFWGGASPQGQNKPVDDALRNAGNGAKNSLGVVDQAQSQSVQLNSPEQYGNHNSFRSAIRLMKADQGLRFITIDVGGWDTHIDMQVNDPTKGLCKRMTDLSKALASFQYDLDRNGLSSRVTVCVMSEFGRRVMQNSAKGTDHGRGGVMFLMGDQVNGNQVKREIPGGTQWSLMNLEDGLDLRVTVDYRHVITEILGKRFGLSASQLQSVFPGFNAVNLGLIKTG